MHVSQWEIGTSDATVKYASQVPGLEGKSHYSRYSLLAVSSGFILQGGTLPRKAIRSFILGHSVMYEIRTFGDNVWRQVWPTLGSDVVQSLRTFT
jgi:hypothetical protein